MASLDAAAYAKREEELEALGLQLSGLAPVTSPGAIAAEAAMQAAEDEPDDPNDEY